MNSIKSLHDHYHYSTAITPITSRSHSAPRDSPQRGRLSCLFDGDLGVGRLVGSSAAHAPADHALAGRLVGAGVDVVAGGWCQLWIGWARAARSG